ncbi:phosphoesterase-like protein [Zymoseptoria brevis]|uniref:Phosphoesterase-like protein n=1 Tax=Zymoseptoria brevis TaxID=1047168 RepID=A0A0F4GSY0_9PEZI|nr:phosphoesterase-like protein [Zymoseptoria brevis]
MAALGDLIHSNRPAYYERLSKASYLVRLAGILHTQRKYFTRSSPCVPLLGIDVVCISDTHNSTPALPPGDVLIHAGDMTAGGSVEELQGQLDWLNQQPHRHKVVIAGNHDMALDKQKAAELGETRFRGRSLRWGSVIYLEHSATTLKFPGDISLNVYGHPETRRNGSWAFQYDRDTDIFTNRIPEDVDILVTHSPPRFHLDEAGQGDGFLLRELWRVKPLLHIFGHMHNGYGQERLSHDLFERYYADICEGKAGLWALLRMLILVLQMLVTSTDRELEQTILVNAAAIGGPRDADRRPAQVVHL